MSPKNIPKINIITIHFGTNHGSALQAYALSNYLDSIGYQTKIIDYVPNRYKVWNSLISRKRGQYPLPVLLLYYPLAVIKSARVRNIFKRFLKHNLHLSKRYTTTEALKRTPPQADIYITGSDQVWNNDYNGNRDYSYFLDFLPADAKRVAYAASFGKTLSKEEYFDNIKPLLYSFNHISVREKDAQNILESMEIPSTHVVDPVFLFTKQQWLSFGSNMIKKDPYTLVYVMDGLYDELLNYAEKVKMQTGNHIYVVSFRKIKDKRINKCFYLATPKDFISLIANADTCITNSFHGTAFSVLFQKRFITIGKEKYNSRMLSLLEKLSLMKHFVPTGKNFSTEEIMSILKHDDITHAEDLLQSWIAESKYFLNSALEEE